MEPSNIIIINFFSNFKLLSDVGLICLQILRLIGWLEVFSKVRNTLGLYPSFKFLVQC